MYTLDNGMFYVKRKYILHYFMFTIEDSKTKNTCLLPICIYKQTSASPVLKVGLHSLCPKHSLLDVSEDFCPVLTSKKLLKHATNILQRHPFLKPSVLDATTSFDWKGQNNGNYGVEVSVTWISGHVHQLKVQWQPLKGKMSRWPGCIH